MVWSLDFQAKHSTMVLLNTKVFLNTSLLHLNILKNFTERTLESFSSMVHQPCRLFWFFAFREVILFLIDLKLHFDFIDLASEYRTYRLLSLL